MRDTTKMLLESKEMFSKFFDVRNHLVTFTIISNHFLNPTTYLNIDDVKQRIVYMNRDIDIATEKADSFEIKETLERYKNQLDSMNVEVLDG